MSGILVTEQINRRKPGAYLSLARENMFQPCMQLRQLVHKAEASTVLQIAKTSSIKLNDNTLSDWDTVTHQCCTCRPNSGNFIKAKYDYDGNYIYVYFEQNTTKADGNIYDLYIDADNDITTGLITGEIPNGAYDVLLEGTYLMTGLIHIILLGAISKTLAITPSDHQ